MATTWKTVRIFISSTFRDMHAERDHLVKIVFPQLRHWCEQRFLHLVDVDLRWGVTEADARNGRAVDICLREIDNSRPFFVCVLGGRYGTPLEVLPNDSRYRIVDVNGAARFSVTHLEILHAASDPIASSDNQRGQVCPHSFFYFRKDGCVPEAGALSGLTADQANRHTETYFDRHLRQQLDDLKHWIRSQFAHVYEYSVSWDPTIRNEDSLTQGTEGPPVGRVVGLEEFGERVFTDLTSAIAVEYADHVKALGKPGTSTMEERDLQEAFIENRTRMFVPRPQITRQLTEYARGTSPYPLELRGLTGTGKSAVLSYWLKENTDPADWTAKWDRNTHFVARFVGASPRSSTVDGLLRRLCDELVERFELTEEPEALDSGDQAENRRQPMEVPGDPAMLRSKWPQFLRAAAARASLVFILDAIDQLDEPYGTSVTLIPTELLDGVRLIFSTTDFRSVSVTEETKQVASDEQFDWNHKRFIEGFVKDRDLPSPSLTVTALDGEMCLRIIREIPILFAKSLDQSQIELLMANPATRYPLFLTTALEELRVYGAFESVTARIASLPDVAASEDVTVQDIGRVHEELFGQVLNRLELEYQRTPTFVPMVFSALASAKEGLTESELTSVVGSQFTSMDGQVVDGMIQVLLRQLRPYLARKGTPNGVLVSFFHRSFLDGVTKRYLHDDTSRLKAHRALAAYFTSIPLYLTTPSSLQATRRAPNARKLVELPFQCLRAQNWNALESVLTDLLFIEAKCQARLLGQLQVDYQRAMASLPANAAQLEAERQREQALSTHAGFLLNFSWLTTSVKKQASLWSRLADWAIAKLVRYFPPSGSWRDDQLHLFLGSIPDTREMLQRTTSLRQDGSTTATSSDRITAYASFVSSHAHLLARFPHLTVLLARNYACDGPVVSRAEGLTPPGIGRDPRPPLSVNPFFLRCLEGHSDAVVNVAIASRGRLAVSASHDGTVRVWNLQTGVAEAVLKGHTGEVCAVAVTPAGWVAASGGYDGTVRVWDLMSKQQTAVLTGHTNIVTSVAMTPDGSRVVSVSVDDTMRVWDAKTAQQVHVMAISPAGDGVVPMTVHLTPDGLLATVLFHKSGVNCIRAINLKPMYEENVLEWREGVAFQASLTLDGRRVLTAAGLDDGIRVWDMKRRSQVATLQGSSEWVTALALSDDGRMAVSINNDSQNVRYGSSLSIWDVESGTATMVRSIKGHTDRVAAIALVPDGRIAVTASCDKTLRVWNLLGVDAESLPGHGDNVSALALSPDGKTVASVGWDQVICHWNIETGEKIAECSMGEWAMSELVFSKDGLRMVGACASPVIFLFCDPVTGVVVERMAADFPASWSSSEDHGKGYWVTVAGEGGKAISLNLWGGLEVWNLETQTYEFTRSEREDMCTVPALSPDGTLLLTGHKDGRLELKAIGGATTGQALRGHAHRVNCLSFNDRGTLIASTDTDNTLCVWDVETGQLKSSCAIEGALPGRKIFLNDDGSVAHGICGDNTLRAWKVATGDELGIYCPDSMLTAATAMNPAARFACGTRDGQIHMLQLRI